MCTLEVPCANGILTQRPLSTRDVLVLAVIRRYLAPTTFLRFRGGMAALRGKGVMRPQLRIGYFPGQSRSGRRQGESPSHTLRSRCPDTRDRPDKQSRAPSHASDMEAKEKRGTSTPQHQQVPEKRCPRRTSGRPTTEGPLSFAVHLRLSSGLSSRRRIPACQPGTVASRMRCARCALRLAPLVC